jgi:hypothetical protein
MKVLIVTDVMLGDEQLWAGQMAIVSQEDGDSLIVAGRAVQMDEDGKGGFAVPMPDDTP